MYCLERGLNLNICFSFSKSRKINENETRVLIEAEHACAKFKGMAALLGRAQSLRRSPTRSPQMSSYRGCSVFFPPQHNLRTSQEDVVATARSFPSASRFSPVLHCARGKNWNSTPGHLELGHPSSPWLFSLVLHFPRTHLRRRVFPNTPCTLYSHSSPG